MPGQFGAGAHPAVALAGSRAGFESGSVGLGRRRRGPGWGESAGGGGFYRSLQGRREFGSHRALAVESHSFAGCRGVPESGLGKEWGFWWCRGDGGGLESELALSAAGLRADLGDKSGVIDRNRGGGRGIAVETRQQDSRRAGVSKTRSQKAAIVMNRAERWDFGAATDGRSIGEVVVVVIAGGATDDKVGNRLVKRQGKECWIENEW